MYRMIKCPLFGREFNLNYSMGVLFRVNERFGSVEVLLGRLSSDVDSPEAFDDVAWTFTQLANDGELARRQMGYDPQPLLADNEITPHITPAQFLEMKEAIRDAVYLGYTTEENAQDEPSDVDEGLAQIMAKKKVRLAARARKRR